MGYLWLHRKTGCKNTPSSSYFSSPRVQACRIWLRRYLSLPLLVMPKGSEVHLYGFLLPLSLSFFLFSPTWLSPVRYLNRLSKRCLKAKVQLLCPEAGERGKMRRQTKAKPDCLAGVSQHHQESKCQKFLSEEPGAAPPQVDGRVRIREGALCHVCTQCL